MKKEYAERWVSALRSGEYKQTCGLLRRSDGFCCLGVLSDLVKDEIGAKWVDNIFYSNEGVQNTVLLSREVMELTGVYGVGLHVAYLVRLNDSGSTFSEIADIIEKNWKVL